MNAREIVGDLFNRMGVIETKALTLGSMKMKLECAGIEGEAIELMTAEIAKLDAEWDSVRKERMAMIKQMRIEEA
jgi:hypothetical protein